VFEAVCVRRQQPLYTSEALDLGFLAEAMLFYQRVHLIVDMDILQQLAFECGPALVIEFIKEGFLNVSYLPTRTAISEKSWEPPLRSRSGKFYQPVTILNAKEIGSEKDNWRLEKVAPEIFSKAAGGPGYGRQLGRSFAELVPTINVEHALDSALTEDLTNAMYVERAVAELLNAIAPTYRLPQDYRFQISKEGELYQIDTNIDFQRANESFNKAWHPRSMTQFLSHSSLLLYILEVRRDLFFAANENAELATHAGNAAIINVKCREILHARSKSEHDIEAFQEMTLADGHEIGNSLKSGYRTWRDLLTLLKDARKFKEWLRQKDPEVSLIHEYIKALEKETWVGTAPVKTLRFLISTGLGLIIPPVASIGLSGADAFLVDRFLGGWKPNQFVNGPLKGFARLD
jgi:hypothetical protein